VNLSRIRWGVRGVLFLGVAASVVANILHARENPISQSIAAWPPLALLITIELISRVPVHSRTLAATRFVATAAIAGIAAWVSYQHMTAVASRYGETGASPYLMPISVDGLIVVASICLVELAGRIRAAEAEIGNAIADFEGTQSAGAPALTADETRRSTTDFEGVDPVNTLATTADHSGDGTDMVADPWQYATPVGGVDSGDTPDLLRDAPKKPAPVKSTRVKPRSLTAAERVSAAHAKNPAATHERIAKAAAVSVSTVKRHRPSGSPSEPLPAHTRVNGNVPDLEGVPL
jgi:hypothetical protein